MELPKKLIDQTIKKTEKKGPLFWIRKTNTGFDKNTRIKFMDTKYIHTAMCIVKDNTKLSTDKFGEFTREEWLNAFKDELDRRNIMINSIFSNFKRLNRNYHVNISNNNKYKLN